MPPQRESGPFPGGHRRLPARRLMLAKLSLFVPMLVAAFILHLSGTALVILHVVRFGLVAALVFAGGWLRSRAGRHSARSDA